jgi:hypothetical protein
MIEKNFTTNEGEVFLVGFNEIGSDKDGIECHILNKGMFGNKSVYHKLYLKGIAPDYKDLADWTIYYYKRDLEQKEGLLKADWS